MSNSMLPNFSRWEWFKRFAMGTAPVRTSGPIPAASFGRGQFGTAEPSMAPIFAALQGASQSFCQQLVRSARPLLSVATASPRPSTRAVRAESVPDTEKERWLARCTSRLIELRPHDHQERLAALADGMWPDVGHYDPSLAAEIEHETLAAFE